MLVTLTPTERRELENALSAVEPVSRTAAVVLRRVGRRVEVAEVKPALLECFGDVFGVTAQTIRNWIDKGLIRAYVTPAGTRLVSTDGWENVRAFRRAGRRNPGSMTEEQVATAIEHLRDG